MLDLDAMREEFARHLAGNGWQRWRIDASLAHVLELAYRRGMEDSPAMALVRDLLDPERFGHAVTEEVRDAARRVVDAKSVGLDAVGGQSHTSDGLCPGDDNGE